jgi:hypothetical protein
MILTDLQEVADAVVRRAQRQGFVLPSDIREELANTDLPESQWRDVIRLSRDSLRYQSGRYYYKSAMSRRMREEERKQRTIQRAVRQVISQYKKAKTEHERRKQSRIDFMQTVNVRLEDHREVTVLTRDISATGIRLIATRSLLGQKIQVRVPQGEDRVPACFVARILWTCSVGDGLFENGGTFLEMAENPPEILRLVSEETVYNDPLQS